jgi:hypothetical protein
MPTALPLVLWPVPDETADKHIGLALLSCELSAIGGDMFLEFSIVGLAPAALVVLAGTFFRARQKDERLGRRWLFFLLSVVVLLFGTQLPVLRWEMYRFGMFFQPALVGTLAALLVHLGVARELWSRRTIWIMLPTTLAMVALMVYWWIETDPLIPLISVITALTWQAWEWRGRRRWLAYLALLLLLLMVAGWILNPYLMYLMLMNRSKWLYGVIAVGNLFVWPMVAIVLVARLIHTSTADPQPSNWLATVFRLAMTVILLLVLGDLIVTETVWVIAEDSLSIIPTIVFLAATAAAMLLAWTVTGWRRLAALGFVLLVTLTVSRASSLGWSMSPTSLTDARAERIERAIQAYHERQGRYPSRLGDLVPLYLWRIPQPMIFRDQTWCYQGGDDYYRLGYVHQPGYGWPLESISIRIHAAVGEPPGLGWPCDDALERARSQSPWQ